MTDHLPAAVDRAAFQAELDTLRARSRCSTLGAFNIVESSAPRTVL
jgi:hypothetical protein